MKKKESERKGKTYSLGVTDSQKVDQMPKPQELGMRNIELINSFASGLDIYRTDRAASVHEMSNLPFRISPQPLVLPKAAASLLEEIGPAYSSYYLESERLIRELPKTHRWVRYLTGGKPPYATRDMESCQNHLFLRPDFIMTPTGLSSVEIETSPFGLALSSFLTDSYSKLGYHVMGDRNSVFKKLVQGMFGDDSEGKSATILLTDHTLRYEGQMRMLAKGMMDYGVNASVAFPKDISFNSGIVFLGGQPQDAVYRGFYLHEMEGDETLMQLASQKQTALWPPIKAHMEEKAIMGLIWDAEFEEFFKDRIGKRSFDLLRHNMARTWVLKQDVEDKPDGISDWKKLADLSRAERTYVVKPSGFIASSSWSRGIHLLHKMSKTRVREVIDESLASNHTFIIQEFRRGEYMNHPYMDFESGKIRQMRGKIRMTPYYGMPKGDLITSKMTLCEATDRIHATVDSINTAVAREQEI